MSDSTYSFADYNITISSPMGVYDVQGEGIGDITISPSTTKSTHNTGADGSIMTSKIAGKNAAFAINCQQTSSLNNWMVKLYNLLDNGPSSVWTSISILVTNSVQKEVATLTGCSFEKLSDKPMAAEGGMRSWNLLAQKYIEVTL